MSKSGKMMQSKTHSFTFFVESDEEILNSIQQSLLVVYNLA